MRHDWMNNLRGKQITIKCHWSMFAKLNHENGNTQSFQVKWITNFFIYAKIRIKRFRIVSARYRPSNNFETKRFLILSCIYSQKNQQYFVLNQQYFLLNQTKNIASDQDLLAKVRRTLYSNYLNKFPSWWHYEDP